jgi:hypothetical protein
MEKKELDSMKKHRGLFLALGLTALLGLSAREVRAEAITMTVSVTGAAAAFPVDTIANTTNPDAYTIADLTALNAYLTANHSEYQFRTLGGQSNITTATTQGQLNVSGTIISNGVGGTNAGLTLIESETGFTAPTGPSGTLTSTATANLTNQTSPGQISSSAYDNTGPPVVHAVAGPYSVPTTGGMATAPVSPVMSSYMLTNTISFTLGLGTATTPIVNGFSTTATITSAVPEPASLVMMLTSLPVPLVVVGWLRRRRASA